MKSKLTVLGSGLGLSSFYSSFDFRNPSGHLLQTEKLNILLDCGEGMRRRMDELKFDYFDLDAILISHSHPDHFAIIPLIQSMIVRARYEKIRKHLEILLPKELQQSIIDEWNVKTPENTFENLNELVEISFSHCEDKTSMELGEIRMTSFKAAHGPLDAYSFRIGTDRNIISYSGDAGETANLLDCAKDADIFICEGSTRNGEEENSGHLSAFQAGKVAREARVKHLVIVHYSGKDSKEDMEKEIRNAGFNGMVDIASDLDSFTLES